MVSNLLNNVSDNINEVYPLIRGLVGTGVAAEFRTFATLYNKLPEIKDIFDGTDKSGINLELTFRPGTDLDVMKAMLYKKTALESVFGTQMRYVDMQRGKASIYNLKQIMMYWLNFLNHISITLMILVAVFSFSVIKN